MTPIHSDSVISMASQDFENIDKKRMPPATDYFGQIKDELKIVDNYPSDEKFREEHP